jgi:predicted ATPase
VKRARVDDYKRRLANSANNWPVRLERFVFDTIPSAGSGEIPFSSPIVVLAGPNGVGKTTLLRAIWAAASPQRIDGELSTSLKLSSGRAVLAFRDANGVKTSGVIFADGRITGDAGVGVDVVHIDASDESKYNQETFCEFSEIDDLINGVGFLLADARTLDEINYISCRDYREIKIYELESDRGVVPFFEVSYGNDRYDSRTMGAGESALLLLWWTISRAANHAILLIEEPETHLSPASQETLTHFILSSAVEKQLNVVLTSHSHRIINVFSEREMVYLFRDGTGIRTIEGLPPPALLETIGIKINIDVIVLVEDALAATFLRLMLERHRTALSRRIEISVRKGEANITGLLRKIGEPFSALKVIGCFDGDMRGNIPQDIAAVSTFLPGDRALERIIREIVNSNPEALGVSTGSPDVPAILFGLQGTDHHDWYSGLCHQLGLTSAQLFPMLFRIWETRDGNSVAANSTLDELDRVIRTPSS